MIDKRIIYLAIALAVAFFIWTKFVSKKKKVSFEGKEDPETLVHLVKQPTSPIESSPSAEQLATLPSAGPLA